MGRRGLVRLALALATSGLMLGLVAGAEAATGLPDREADPIVLTGSQAPGLIGIEPGDVVAFRWDGVWKQIPVQVDERKIANYRAIRHLSGSGVASDFKEEVYADPNTYTGADGQAQMSTTTPSFPISGTAGDPNLDVDDEIALMSKDSGSSAADQPDPAGVDGSTRTPIRIKDPLGTGAVSFVYLFRKTRDLDPAAGTDYVNYAWKFEPALIPDYFSGYDFGSIGDNANGPPSNPEASSVETGLYQQTFPGRWMVDGLNITAGGANGVDILDGDKSMVGTSNCGRNELTFSRGGGGFIAAIDGPIRAIRSYVGANSGTYTQRDQVYYEGLVETNTYLRVHPGIDNLVTAMDYSEAAFNMTYRNSLNPDGVTVDGVPDQGVVEGNLSWEQISGAQGSATLVSRIATDIETAVATSYYQDDLTPELTAINCSGDDRFAIGASGARLNGTGAFNTDPTRNEPVKNVTSTRFTYIDGPGEPMETAVHHSQQIDSPLVLATGAASDPSGAVPTPGPPKPGTTPGRTNWVGLKVSVKPKFARVKAGSARRFKVKVRNIGDLPGRRLRVCPRKNRKLARTSKCRKINKLRPGKAVRLRFRVRPRRAAKGRKFKVRFRAKARKSTARTAAVKIRVPGR